MGSNNLVCKTITLLFLYKFFPELFIASLAKASSSLIRSEASKHYYNWLTTIFDKIYAYEVLAFLINLFFDLIKLK